VAEAEILLRPGLAVSVTVSLGAATVLSGEVASAEELIAQADQALYQVKAAGGNHGRSAPVKKK
jgi:PleD family two-component response regulator